MTFLQTVFPSVSADVVNNDNQETTNDIPGWRKKHSVAPTTTPTKSSTPKKSPFSLLSTTTAATKGTAKATATASKAATATETKTETKPKVTTKGTATKGTTIAGAGTATTTTTPTKSNTATTVSELAETNNNGKNSNHKTTKTNWSLPFKGFQNDIIQKDKEMSNSANSFFFLDNEITRVESKVKKMNANVNVIDPRKGEQQRRRSSSLSQLDEESDLFLLEEEEEKALVAATTTSTLPDRWLDYFCIVGLDPNAKLNSDSGDDEKDVDNKTNEKKEGATYDIKNKNNNSSHSTKKTKSKTKTKKGINNNDKNNNKNGLNNKSNKPILLDRYPKENRSDMEFPEHLSTFCFPNGYHPLKYKVRTTPATATASTPSNNNNTNNKKSKQKQKVTTIRYHHNAPEPSLCTMVLTSGSGHRLYCSTLTVYEMREERNDRKKKTVMIAEQVQQKVDSMKEKVQQTADNTMTATSVSTPNKKEEEKTPRTKENWWEESTTMESKQKKQERKRKMQIHEETLRRSMKNNNNTATTTATATATTTTSSCSTTSDDEKVKESDSNSYYWMVPKCLVLVSHYPFFQGQGMALKELFYTVQSGTSPIPFERYIAHLLEDIPLPRCHLLRRTQQNQNNGQQQQLNSSNTTNYNIVEWTSWLTPITKNMTTPIPPTIRLEQPPPNQLPLLDVSMEPLFRTLSLSNILVIWATLLQEGKIVLACTNAETASLLTPISEALLSLLFPLEWQGIYVPVLPNNESVIDILQAPIPYLIGIVATPTKMGPQDHPAGVLWVDLESDTIHLGFKDDSQAYFQNQSSSQSSEEELPVLPALPNDAALQLKIELEEIVDPLFLPTPTGIKGQMTVGDRSVDLENSFRPPYALRTKLFGGSDAIYTPTPRNYILTQSSKVPPRSCTSTNAQQQQQSCDGDGGNNQKGLQWEDYNFIPSHMKKKKNRTKDNKNNDGDRIVLCGISLEDMLQCPCAEDTTSTTSPSLPFDTDIDDEEKKDDTVTSAQAPTPTPATKLETTTTTTAQQQQQRRDSTKSNRSRRRDSTTSQDSDFMVHIKRQGRSMQAHTDRFMAVFGVDYATPSQYAAQTSLLLLGGEDDVLNRQDDIAANFYSVVDDTQNEKKENDNHNNKYNNNNLSERVRQCFLNFLVTTLSRYNFFVNQDTQRMEEDRFLKSMNLRPPQRDYLRMIITSQMFEIFLSQQDLSSIRRRRLFDEYIIQHRGGGVVSDVGGGRGVFGSHKFNKPSSSSLSSETTTTTNTTTASKFEGFVNRKRSDHAAAAAAAGSKNNTKMKTPTPLLDSKQWKKPVVIVPPPPCVIGLKAGRVHCHDRRFPDHLQAEECITNTTVSPWQLFWEGTWLCGSSSLLC